MLKRFLSLTEVNPSIVDEWSFNDLIRTGYEKGLLASELSIWQGYRYRTKTL